jgi:phosphoribosylanthranilate isomerase
MVKIKVCGITSLDDALAAVDLGADALGFNFYSRSPRYLSPAQARQIIEKIPSFILTVGIFVNVDQPQTVGELATEAGVGAIQLHGEESPEYVRMLDEFQLIKALRVGPDFKPQDVLKYPVNAILLDAFSPQAHGGTGHRFDWNIAKDTVPCTSQLYLAGGLNAENVAQAIAFVGPYAVDVCSGVESAPGRKDLARLRAFISAVRLSSLVS